MPGGGPAGNTMHGLGGPPRTDGRQQPKRRERRFGFFASSCERLRRAPRRDVRRFAAAALLLGGKSGRNTTQTEKNVV